MSTGVWIIGACLVVFLVLLYVVNHLAPPELREKTTSEKLATREGREELAAMMGTKYGRVPKDTINICPTCEGHGRLGHGTIMVHGVVNLSTWGEHCSDCGGTGIKGGLDYVVMDCPDCSGTGVKDGVKCGMCEGTKVVRRDKATT